MRLVESTCSVATALGLLTGPAAEPPITLVGAAFDERRARLVVVGYAGSGDHVETWERSEDRWRRVSTDGPSPRTEPLVIYDRSRGTLLLYGGNANRRSPPLTDTWQWNGVKWSELASAGPSLPLGGALAYDSQSGRVMLYDGSRGGGDAMNSGLWSWDGDKWAPASLTGTAPAAPPARGLSGLAYDEGRRRLVLFGGFEMANGKPRQLGDTWEWYDERWHQVDVAGPSARDHVAMAYDATRQAVVLHGGGTPAGLEGDTWTYDGDRWTRLGTDGPARGRHRLVFDASVQAPVLYGGWMPGNRQSNELWRLRGTVWEQVSPEPMGLRNR